MCSAILKAYQRTTYEKNKKIYIVGEESNLIMNDLFDNLFTQEDIKTMFQSGEQISSFLYEYYQRIASLVKLNVLSLNFEQTPSTPELVDTYFETRDNQKSSSTNSYKKMIGSITAEYFRYQIAKILEQHPEYKISDNNVYVEDCHIEFDFLILKADAVKQEGMPVYRVNDVVAVLECKSNGVYTEYHRDKISAEQYDVYDLKNFVNAYFKLLHRNEHIKIGYMSMSENSPKSVIGKSNFIYGMLLYMSDRFNNFGLTYNEKWYHYIARCHFPANRKDLYSSDQQWQDFVLNLINVKI